MHSAPVQLLRDDARGSDVAAADVANAAAVIGSSSADLPLGLLLALLGLTGFLFLIAWRRRRDDEEQELATA